MSAAPHRLYCLYLTNSQALPLCMHNNILVTLYIMSLILSMCTELTRVELCVLYLVTYTV